MRLLLLLLGMGLLLGLLLRGMEELLLLLCQGRRKRAAEAKPAIVGRSRRRR